MRDIAATFATTTCRRRLTTPFQFRPCLTGLFMSTETDLIPVNQMVLIQLHDATDTAVVLPDNVMNPDGYVTVVATAADCESGVAPGDNIIFRPGATVHGIKNLTSDRSLKLGLLHETSIVAIDRRTRLSVG